MIIEDFNVISSAGRALVVVFSHASEHWWAANGINLILAGLTFAATIAAWRSSTASKKSVEIMDQQYKQQVAAIEKEENKNAPVMELSSTNIFKFEVPRQPNTYLGVVQIILKNISNQPLKELKHAVFLLDIDAKVINQKYIDSPLRGGTHIGNPVIANCNFIFNNADSNKVCIATFCKAIDHRDRKGNDQQLFDVISVDFYKPEQFTEGIATGALTSREATDKICNSIKDWCSKNGYNKENVDYWPFGE
jgi:hypothetical protein